SVLTVVGKSLAAVVVYPGGAQHRSRDSVAHGVLWSQDSHVAHPIVEYPVAGQELVDLDQLLFHGAQRPFQLPVKTVGQVGFHSSDPAIRDRKASPGDLFYDLVE